MVNGLIASGRIHAGDPILFGPDSTGAFQSSVVKSIQRKRAPVNSAEAGQCVSLALKRVRRAAVRKGMVVVQKTDSPPKGAMSRLSWDRLGLLTGSTAFASGKKVRRTGSYSLVCLLLFLLPLEAELKFFVCQP